MFRFKGKAEDVPLFPQPRDPGVSLRFDAGVFIIFSLIFLPICAMQPAGGLWLDVVWGPDWANRGLSVVANAVSAGAGIAVFIMLVARLMMHRSKFGGAAEQWILDGMTDKALIEELDLVRAWSHSASDPGFRRDAKARADWLESQLALRRAQPSPERRPRIENMTVRPSARAKASSGWVGGTLLLLGAGVLALSLAQGGGSEIVGCVLLALYGLYWIARTWTVSLRLTAEHLEMRRYFRRVWVVDRGKARIEHTLIFDRPAYMVVVGTQRVVDTFAATMFPGSQVKELHLQIRRRRRKAEAPVGAMPDAL